MGWSGVLFTHGLVSALHDDSDQKGPNTGEASVAPKGLPLRMSQPGNSAPGSSQQKSSSVAVSLIRLSMDLRGEVKTSILTD